MKKFHHPSPAAGRIEILILWMGLALIGQTNLAATSPAIGGANKFSSVPYRMISFNDGEVDMEVVRAAKAMGYNGVQIQTEGGTVRQIEGFAAANRRTHVVEQCHQLGMKVSIWVHELNDIPAEFLVEPHPGDLLTGEVLCNYGTAGNQKIIINIENPKFWELLRQRYEHFLNDSIPDVDILVLTVTETQVHGTNPKLFKRLVLFLDDECRHHGKQLWVRTFVWHPNDLQNLMSVVRDFPEDVVTLSKCVPQDWHLWSINAPELGQVGHHQQIEEWDVVGEFSGLNKLVNCMPELLREQWDYGKSQGISGICVRVKRGAQTVLHQPSEVNMWTLGQLSSGQAASVNEVWKTWTNQRYGLKAGPAVIPILADTFVVIRETFYIDHYMFFDPRKPMGSPTQADAFQIPSNPQFWSAELKPVHDRLVMGDPVETDKVEKIKKEALRRAGAALTSLEKAQSLFDPADYAQLRRGLLTNHAQLAWRSSLHLSYLHYRALVNTSDPKKRADLISRIRADLLALRTAINNADPMAITDGDQGLRWADEMERLLQ
jgi:hypothetical protein